MTRGASSDLLAQLKGDLAAARAQVSALGRDRTRLLDAASLVSTDDEHDPDGATSAFERAQIDALIHAATARVDALDAAIARVADGSYGRCRRCAGRIPAARLEARPSATTCIDCAR